MSHSISFLPAEWIENNIDTYLYKHRAKTNLIYIILLMVIMIAIVLLPFIYVDVTIQSKGVVRPTNEMSVLTSPLTEIVQAVYAKDGGKLRKGDVVLMFKSTAPNEKMSYQYQRSCDIKAQIMDLVQLSRGLRPTSFSSQARQLEYAKFLSEIRRLQTDLQQYKVEWERYSILFHKGLISESEYNEYYYRYLDKWNELKLLRANQESAWETDLARLKLQLSETQANLTDIKQNKDLYVVKSPINGTLEQFSGIYPGSHLQAGSTIGVISPNTQLHVEAYVVPRDIAFIKEGMRVKVQVESFNYNEWGTLEGHVENISSDYIRDNNGSLYYKVKCKLSKDYLQLSNQERRGYIKKGMTAIVHFVVTRQSLFDLLYKNIDEWMNPTQYQQQGKTINQ